MSLADPCTLLLCCRPAAWNYINHSKQNKTNLKRSPEKTPISLRYLRHSLFINPPSSVGLWLRMCNGVVLSFFSVCTAPIKFSATTSATYLFKTKLNSRSFTLWYRQMSAKNSIWSQIWAVVCDDDEPWGGMRWYRHFAPIGEHESVTTRWHLFSPCNEVWVRQNEGEADKQRLSCKANKRQTDLLLHCPFGKELVGS